MGTFSIWHWIIVLIWFGLSLYFVLKPAPSGENRFGPPPNSMNFFEAIGSFFKNYVNFSGRASRSEFWYSVLGLFLISFVLAFMEASTGAREEDFKPLSSIFSLAVLIPMLALACRRLHDINRSGWHQLLSWLPPVGTIALLVWYCIGPKDDVQQVSTGDQFGRKSNNHLGAQQASYGIGQATHTSKLEALERLSRLKENGSLSSEEFESEKRKLLNS